MPDPQNNQTANPYPQLRDSPREVVSAMKQAFDTIYALQSRIAKLETQIAALQPKPK